MEAISGIGIFSSIIFALLLINKKKKTFPDSILVVWMVLFSIHLFIPFMMAIGNRFFIEKVNGLDIGFYTLHITFMYYYTLAVTNTIPGFKLNHLTFLLPTAAIYVVQTFLDNNVNLFSDLIRQYFFNDNVVFHLSGVVSLNLFFGIYFIRKFYIVLFQHRKNIKNNYSYSENIDLRWLQNLFIASLVFTIIVGIYLIALLKGKLHREWIDNFYFSSFSIFVVVLGFWGYKQGVILLDKNAEKSIPDESSTRKDSPLRVRDSEKEEKRQPDSLELKSLYSYMEEKKPYLDSKLSIGSVANDLGIHMHQLSKIINQQLNKNFFDFVNDFRVDEFKKLVADPKNKHFSILGLAFEAGFNSKATFNRIFKNTAGQTPSQFRESFKYS